MVEKLELYVSLQILNQHSPTVTSVIAFVVALNH